MSNPILEAALAYGARGWNVFPLNGTKPFAGSHGYKDASDDPLVIKRMWKRHPDANIGVACDSTTGPVVLDCDGASGADFLARWQAEHGPLPKTLTATSGRPGRKHFFFDPPASGEAIGRRIKPLTHDGQPVALDLLGDGGYVLVSPSIKEKHGVTYQYRWLNDRPLAPFPEALLGVLQRQPGETKTAAPLPDVIGEGQRDQLLTSLAGSARRRGASEPEILALLREVNARRCRPPLSEQQLAKIARSIGARRAMPLGLATANDFTENAFAERFAELERGTFRYCKEWKKWLIWDGTRWANDLTLAVDRAVAEMIKDAVELAAREITDGPELGKVLQRLNSFLNHKRLEHIRDRACSQRGLVITPDQLDADPWLLNAANGTLDLRTVKLGKNGALRVTLTPPEPKQLLTKRLAIPFDPSAEPALWHGFLTAVTEGDRQIEAYLQRAVGYSLLGLVREQILCFCYGEAGTGKSTFQETILALFGDYGTTIDFETLLYSRYGMSSDARRDLPRLSRARYVQAKEPVAGGRWNESLVKEITGGDTLSGRWLYGEKFDFQPSHTLWCRANEQPESHDPSDALWQRMRLFPFETVFRGTEAEDPKLKEKLHAELPGILNWALVGLALYLRDGLGEIPERMRKVAARQRLEGDPVQQFLDAKCVFYDRAWTATSDLYEVYSRWTRSLNKDPLNVRAFGRRLAALKGERFSRSKRDGRKGWRGISLAG